MEEAVRVEAACLKEEEESAAVETTQVEAERLQEEARAQA